MSDSLSTARPVVSANSPRDGTTASTLQYAIDQFHFLSGHGVQVKSLQLSFTCEKVQKIRGLL